MLYRIYTEDKNRMAVRAILKKEFQAFTVVIGHGFWKGKPERTLIVDVVGDRIETKIRKVAKQIKRQNHQAAVLVELIANRTIVI
jgi:hypothetical protein